ncbi:MAG: DUF1648 domain-containing protein, partial [Candidatus Micrarchaeota archaeon]
MLRISNSLLLAFGLVFVSLLIGVYLYPEMPEQMASHWNASGEVNGFMEKFWGLFLMPFMSIFLLGLFVFIPCIDP